MRTAQCVQFLFDLFRRCSVPLFYVAFDFKCEKAYVHDSDYVAIYSKLEFDCPECNISDSYENNRVGMGIGLEVKKKNVKDFRVEPDNN